MLQDNRLDFISNIDPLMIESMTRVRQIYMEIDEVLREIDQHEKFISSGAVRVIALARTHLEISLQFAIKTFCLLGELKKVE